jgi:hypothetical protein
MYRRTTRSVLAALGLAGGASITLALGAACSGTSADQACSDSAHAQCTKLATCSPLNLQTAYGDEATCEMRLKANCVNAQAAKSTGASADKTEACAQAYPAYACSDYLNKTNIPAACTQATGSLPNGTACAFPAQCVTGFCAIAPGSACGACAAVPAQGDSCAQLTSCGPDLACTSDTQTCTKYAGPNAACGQGQPCGTGLSCVAPGGAGTPGTCQAAGALGATCDGTAKTGPACDTALGLYCDGQTKQCAQAGFGMAGQACGYVVDAGTLTDCLSGACVNGQCVGRAADNGACTVPDSGAYNPTAGCLPPARCVGTTCQLASATCM